MVDPTHWRRDRIEKLLHELRYECVRGIMEGDLESEYLSFMFLTPSRNDTLDIVAGEFNLRPRSRLAVLYNETLGDVKWRK